MPQLSRLLLRSGPGLVLSLCLAAAAQAQVVPDLAPALQGIADRQAERAQQRAAERALQQVEVVQQRVAEQAGAQQADAIQSRTLERVASQVERAQQQALERAQQQAGNRAEQAAGARVQQQVTGQVEARGAELRRAGERLPAAAGGLAAQVAGGEAAGVVRNRAGDELFVELTLPDGARAIAFEWIMLVTPQERARLEAEAAPLMAFLREQRPLGLSNGELLTFRVPPDLDVGDAILELVPADLRDQIDRNHLFAPREGPEVEPGAAPLPSKDSARPLPLPQPMRAVCEAPLSIGMVDAAVDVGHPAFAQLQGSAARIVTRSFVETDLEQSAAHGTAVAALWLGSLPAADPADSLRPLLPAATLYSAAVFHAGAAGTEGASAARILAALDWLAQQPALQVVNMSLAGPPNRLLARGIALLAQRDIQVVAAVGNEGPHAPARYPAALEPVIAVAAADREGQPYRWSNQGPHVDYAALGVAVPTTVPGQGLQPQSGTSFAAPVVTALLACARQLHDTAAALALLDGKALDLGEPGRDAMYGKGLLHPW